MAGQQDMMVTVGGIYDPLIQGAGPAAAQVQKVFSSINFNSAGLKDYGNGLGVISRRASEFERSLTSANSRVFAFGIAAGQVYLAVRAFDALVKSTIDVQKQLTDINVIANLSTSQLGKLSSSLFSIANLTGQSFKTASETMLQFSRQGLGVQEALKRTADAMNLARIGGLDLDTAIKSITTTLNTFNEVGLDSTALLNRISLLDTRFAISGNVMAEALLRVSSVAADSKVPLNNLLGMITSLQQLTGRGGQVIGTSLATTIQRIGRPETLNQLQQLGVATEDLNGNFLSADQILTNLAKVYDKLSDSQKNQITQTVSGIRNANQFKALMADLANQNSITARATTLAGEATDQAARRQAALNQTLAAQFNTVKNNLTQMSANIGNTALAPALQNIFKGINFGANNAFGDQIGQGLLKGLGNYLSGPGLALGTVLIGKFFAQFGQFAAKSLATIIEQGSNRLQIEGKVNTILEKQPALLSEIEKIQLSNVSAAQKELDIQNLITKALLEQSAARNFRASNVSATLGSLDTSILGSSSKVATLSRDEQSLIQNYKYIPKTNTIVPLASALDDAIAREKGAGISVSQMRLGNSPFLVSPDNPLGIGLYNTKDEPGGIEQGIQRRLSKGINPKQEGIIPSFAENPFPWLPNRFPQTSFNPVIPPAFDIRSLVPERVLKGPTPDLPENLEFQFSEALKGAFKNLGTSSLPTSNILNELQSLKTKQIVQQTVSNIENPSSKILTSERIDNPTAFARLNNPFKIQEELTAYIKNVEKNFINPLDEGHKKILDVLKQSANKYGTGANSFGGDIERQINDFQNSLLNDPRFTQLQQEIVAAEKKALQLKLTQQAESQLNNLNIWDATGGRLFGYIGGKGKYNSAMSFAEKNNVLASANAARQRLAGQGLMGSFIAPIVAGELQQGFSSAFGQNSTVTRGVSASIGGLGNIASYTLGGLAFGPEGALVGAGIGLLTEIPAAVKAFSDTLPDLQRNLDKLKESSQRTNDAFTTYIQTSQKLADLNTPGNPERANTSLFQYNQLIRQQQESNAGIPAKYRTQISSAIAQNDFSKAYDIFSIAQLNNSQNQNLVSDTTSFKSKSNGFLKSLQFSNDYINKQVSDFAQNKGILNLLSKLGTTNGNDALSYLSLRSNGNENIIGNTTITSRADRDFLINAGIELIGGHSGSGGLKDKNLTALDIFDKLRSYSEENLQQPVNELLGLTNDKGNTLSSLLLKNNQDISSPEKLEKYLNSNNFDSQKISNAKTFLSEFLKLGRNNDESGVLDFLKQSTTPEALKKADDSTKMLQQQAEITAKVYNDMNERLAKLSNTGAEAVTSFEENVINKLSQSLTKLKLQSIDNETASRISEINSGKNDYNKAYFEYIRQNQSNQNQYSQDITNINQSFTKEIGKFLINQTDDFIKELRQNASSSGRAPKDTESIINNRINSINEAFAGYQNISPEGIRTISPNLDVNAISTIKNRLTDQINRYNFQYQTFSPTDFNIAKGYLSNNGKTLAEELSSRYISNDKNQSTEASVLMERIGKLPTSEQTKILSLTNDTANSYLQFENGIPDVIRQNQQFIEKLNEQIGGVRTKLAEAKANLSSNSQIAYKQLLANYDIIGAQFAFNQNNTNLSSNLNRQFSAGAYDLAKRASISSQVGAINLNAQAELLRQKGGFINDLRTSTGSDFGFGINTNLNDIQKQIDKYSNIYNSTKNFTGPLSEEQRSSQSTVQALTKLYNDLNNAQEDNAQKVKQEIDSLSSFTDVQANFIKQRNINKADDGSLSGSDYIRAAFAPLQYNSHTFQRDAVVGLQEFSNTLKNDLSDGLMSAIKNAKNASEAFRNLGLSIASSLAEKAVNIGINSLFGEVTKGVGSLFPSIGAALNSAKGGYIPKFSSGGFVNMGSGIKDDVPAFLSGGEFVINRNAVSKIGKANLDSLNGIGKYASGGTVLTSSFISGNPLDPNYDPGYFTQNQPAGAITSSSLSISPTSAKIGLANAYNVNITDRGIATGSFNTSSLLSGIGLSSQDNPQNRLKASREQYVLGNNIDQINYQKELGAYNTKMDFSLGQAYLAAFGDIFSTYLSSPSQGKGLSNNQLAAFRDGYGPVSPAYANSLGNVDSIYAGQFNAWNSMPISSLPSQSPFFSSYSSSLSSAHYSSLFNPIVNNGFNIGRAASQNAHGGYIRKFSSGGYFGGDSSSDKFRAMVMGGEYIVSPKTVNKYGINYFKGLNNTAKYSSGGYVQSPSSNNDTSQIINVLQQISDKISGNTNTSIINNKSPLTGNNTSQAGSSSPTINVTTNITMGSNGSVSNTTSSVSGGNNGSSNSDTTQQNLKKFSDQFNGNVIQIITKQSRPGGLLYQTFQTRS